MNSKIYDLNQDEDFKFDDIDEFEEYQMKNLYLNLNPNLDNTLLDLQLYDIQQKVTEKELESIQTSNEKIRIIDLKLKISIIKTKRQHHEDALKDLNSKRWPLKKK